MLRNIKNQQRSSDLSLINEKIRLSKESLASNFLHAYIMDYSTKETLKNFEFSVQRLSLKSHPKLEDKILMENLLCINKIIQQLSSSYL